MRIRRTIVSLAGGLLLLPAAAAAHGFGARYDLPVPLSMYIWGAAATVGLSFVLAGFFLRRSVRSTAYPTYDLLRIAPLGWLAHPVVLEAVRAIAVALYLVIVVAGFGGDQNPFKNIAPTAVWVIWWVGLAYVSSLCGDLWALVNPLASMFRWTEDMWRAISGRELCLGRPWPKAWGVWPGAALFLAFAWCELVWSGADRPSGLATIMVIYAVISWAGMVVFGRQAWLAHGDAFALVFGLFARFSPTETAVRDRRREFRLRPYAVGLLVDKPVPVSMVYLALLVLATVSFDGFAETPAWQATLQWFVTTPPLAGFLFDLQTGGFAPGALLATAALILVPAMFFVVFLGFCKLMAVCARRVGDSGDARDDRHPVIELAGLFVLTLVPIAVAYHLAHYLSYLAIAGQYAIPLASDPFGAGWDLFGTKLYFINIAIINARIVWYVSVTAIVLGHVIAVYLAHAMALRTYSTNRAAIASQIPMVALMIGYTMLSLWIVAQPIVQE
ncbi:MAG: hypothetical protein GY791_17210 [Alphaproteobacteria bacterium]|nr:hypothetical protein [Alphaproteobacteria bacterium]